MAHGGNNYQGFNTQQRGSYHSYLPQYPNIDFYENKMPALPNDKYIDQILIFWRGDFQMLEENHEYIQWLFPNREPGLNRDAYVLNPAEIKRFCQRSDLKEKLKSAFEMMLEFYGMKLTGNDKFEFELAENGEERLQILNHKGNHNFQRITRILKCLLELGHHQLMLPWLKFIAKLIYVDKTLNEAEDSFNKFWLPTLDAEDGITLKGYVNELLQSKPGDDKKHSPPITSNSATDKEEKNSDLNSGTKASSTHQNIGTTGKMTSTSSSASKSSYSYDQSTSAPEARNLNSGTKASSTHQNIGTTDKMTITSSSASKSSYASAPEARTDRKFSKIVEFYRNKIPLSKTDLFIDDILSKPDHEMLKKNHIYMYWLFPSEVKGAFETHVEFSAKDAKEIRETNELQQKVLKAFNMMLDFYGMEYGRDETFKLHYPDRLHPLKSKDTPDGPKITRILRAVKELGYKDLMLPWLKFLATLIYETQNIPNASYSMKYHWMKTLDEKEKKELSDYIQIRQEKK